MNQCTVCKSVGGFLHCDCPLSLRIQHDRSVDPTRIRVVPSGVEVKPKPASVEAGGHLDLRYPSRSTPPTPKPADLATDVLGAMTRKLRDYDRLAAALTSAQEAVTKNLERARKAEANYATVARNGSRAVSAMETLRSLLHLPEDGDVVGAVRRHLDAYARLLEERDRFERELDALRAAKPGPMLTPLREESRANRHDAVVVRIGQGIVLTICARAYGNTKTVLSMPQGRTCTFDYDGHSPLAESALADVNAILARYGYVLEAWP